jgi:hypothetical protein
MSFMWENWKVTLIGMNALNKKLLEGSKMQRELRSCPEGVLLQLFAVQLGVEQQCPSITDPDLQ